MSVLMSLPKLRFGIALAVLLLIAALPAHQTPMTHARDHPVEDFSISVDTVGAGVTDPQCMPLALRAANYLADEAFTIDDEILWTIAGDSEVVSPNVQDGIAGLGFFFMEAYRRSQTAPHIDGLVTPERLLYKNLAIGAGNALVAIAGADTDGVFWNSTYNTVGNATSNLIEFGYMTGVAGAADYLAKLFTITGNQTYLETAEDAMNWLIDQAYNAVVGLDEHYAWAPSKDEELSTSWADASPGIGTLLVNLYRVTGNQTYLDIAMGVYNWLYATKVPNLSGYVWRLEPENLASNYYLGRWSGLAGIASFLMDLYSSDDDAMVLDMIQKAAVGFEREVLVTEDGSNYFPYYSDATTYLTGWADGQAGIGSTLLRLANVLDDDSYEEMALNVLGFYEEMFAAGAVMWNVPEAYHGTLIVNPIDDGNAGTLLFFAEGYRRTQDDRYLHAARMVASGLVDRAVTAEDETTWTVSGSSTSISHGYGSGVAGIAAALLAFEASGEFSAFDTVEAAAAYLTSMAEHNAENARWPIDDGAGSEYKAELEDGVAGVGYFFMDLVEKLQAPSMLYGANYEDWQHHFNLAKGAANWLLMVANTETTGAKWASLYDASDDEDEYAIYRTGYLQGAAGIGHYLLRVFEHTGDSAYFNMSRSASEWIMSLNHSSVPGMMSFPRDTYGLPTANNWGEGSAGIADFFLDMYLATNNQTYLEYTEDVAEYLINEAVAEGETYYWTDGAELGNTTYLGRFHGIAGISSFLMDLFTVTDDTDYINYALAGIDYIASKANTSIGDGTAFPDNATDLYPYFFTGYESGAAGIATTMIRANLLNDSSTYDSIIESTYDWLIDMAIEDENGRYLWTVNEFDTAVYYGFYKGSAGIAKFLADYYEVTRSQESYEKLMAAVGSLEHLALPQTVGVAWNPSNETTDDVFLGLDEGVCGTALGVLQFTRFANEAPYLRFTSAEVAATYETIAFTALVGDDQELVSLSYCFNEEIPTLFADIPANGEISANISLEALPDDSHTLTLTAVDNTGKISTASIDFNKLPHTSTLPSSTAPVDTETDEEEDETNWWENEWLYIAIGVGLVCVLLGAFVVKRMKNRKEKAEILE